MECIWVENGVSTITTLVRTILGNTQQHKLINCPVAEAPEGFKESHFDDLGTIEVLVLRCQATRPADADYEGSSSGEDSDVFGDRPIQGEQEEAPVVEEAKPATDTAASAPAPVLEPAAEEEALGGMLGGIGLFDGANDSYGPYNHDGGHDGQRGHWVWHQKDTPEPLHMIPPQYHYPAPPLPQRFRTPRYNQPNPYAHPGRQQEQRNSLGPSAKRVRFDGLPLNAQHQASSGQDPRRPSNMSRPPHRPPSRERVRSVERRPSETYETSSGGPYPPQHIEVGQDGSYWEKHHQPRNASTGGSQYRVDNVQEEGYGDGFSGRNNHAYDDRAPQREQQHQQSVPNRTYSNDPQPQYGLQEPLSSINQPTFGEPQPHYQAYDYQLQRPPQPPLQHHPYHMPVLAPAGYHLPGQRPGYWPMYYPFQCPQYPPPMPVVQHIPGDGQASNAIPPETEEQISPVNTTNVPYANVDQGGPWVGEAKPGDNTQGGGNNGGGWNNNATNGNAGGDWQNEGNGDNAINQGGDWNENNNSGDPPDNVGNNWNEGVNDGNQNSNDNAGGSGWDNNNNDANAAGGGTDAWGNNGNSGGNNNGGGAGNDNGNGWAADTANAPAAGGGWAADAGGEQIETAHSAITGATDIARELYGPHGPYYSFRTLRPDEPRPDAEEEPRYDVPQSLAAQRGSTKQVQPGPGYRYYKKRVIPDYIDSMETPYARFVFKYRTKGRSGSANISRRALTTHRTTAGRSGHRDRR